MKTIQKKSVTVYESENSNKVIKFILAKRFKENFLTMRDNGLLERCFLDENYDVIAKETSGVTHSNILIE